MNAGKWFFLSALLFSSPGWSEGSRIDNIRLAASEIRAVRDAQGMAAAQEAVLDCYQSKPYETCVAQDFIVSNVAARSSRDPLAVLEEMAERIALAMQGADVPLADAQHYILLVKQHGIPAYLQ